MSTSTSTALGPFVGFAHVLGEGMAKVYATDSRTHMTVVIDKSGRRYHMHRKVIRWRPASKEHA